jgi:Tat protein secretion system quality control protein TatD with DNase activity
MKFNNFQKFVKKMESGKISSLLIKNKIGVSNNQFWIDPHCHLQYFTQEELINIIAICKEKNLNYFLTNSTCKEDFNQTIEISKTFPGVIPGIGHHPWYLEKMFEKENWFEEYKEYCEQLDMEGVNYFIGEIGIDGGKPKK